MSSSHVFILKPRNFVFQLVQLSIDTRKARPPYVYFYLTHFHFPLICILSGLKNAVQFLLGNFSSTRREIKIEDWVMTANGLLMSR